MKVKICGISNLEAQNAAIASGADFIGYVFHTPSKRYISLKKACILNKEKPSNIKSVGLFVNADPEEIKNAYKERAFDILQLHGSESTREVALLKASLKCPIIKAFPFKTVQDLEQIKHYKPYIDWAILDAQKEENFGGTGTKLDWQALASAVQNNPLPCPWMLAGGLNAQNIKDALNLLTPHAVDVSSGVEDQQGHKDADKIQDFIDAVRNLS